MDTTGAEPTQSKEPVEVLPTSAKKRGRGRPPGSKNRPPTCDVQAFTIKTSGGKTKTVKLLDELTPRGKSAAAVVATPIRKENKSVDKQKDVTSVFLVADKILRCQVDFLVTKIGEPEQFRAVVKSIWFSYLTKALPDVSGGVDTALQEDKAWLHSLRSQDLCALLQCQPNELQTILKGWKQDSTLSLVDDDEPLETPAKTPKGRKRRKSTLDDADPDDTLVRADNIFHVPERLTMTRILAIIVLALQYCDSDVLVSDLLRWIRVMQFPFVDFNSDGKTMLNREEVALSKLLIGKLQTETISYSHISFHVAATLKLLSVPVADLPTLSTVRLVHRFIGELNLPHELGIVAVELLDSIGSLRYTVDARGSTGTALFERRGANLESWAMAVIVYTLRIYFGLDCVAERKISEETRRLNELLDGLADDELFDFQAWSRHIQYRRLILFRHCPVFGRTSVAASLSDISQHLTTQDPDALSSQMDRLHLSYQTMQHFLQLCDTLAATQPPDPRDAVLGPSLRPFQAHAAALGDHYPALRVNFNAQSLSHVAESEHASRRNSLPKEWILKDPETLSEAEGCFGRIRGALAASRLQAYPVRAHNSTVEPRLDNVQSASLRFMIEVAAEMIEQSPESLLGELMYLELALFPGNPSCKKTGSAASAIKTLINGQ